MVDLEEGCRMPSNLVNVEIDLSNPGKSIWVGMDVHVVWDQRGDDMVIPLFSPS